MQIISVNDNISDIATDLSKLHEKVENNTIDIEGCSAVKANGKWISKCCDKNAQNLTYNPIYMHAMFEVQIKCTHFLVSDLENRVTLTEVTLDGVSLLLTEFRNEGTQFLFVCFYLSYILAYTLAIQ